MTDYFDALMRASALPVEGQTAGASLDAPRPTLDRPPLEVHDTLVIQPGRVALPTPMRDQTTSPTASPASTSAPPLPVRSDQRPPAPPPHEAARDAAADQLPPSHRSAPDPARQVTVFERAAAAEAPRSEPRPPDQPIERSSGDALVRAMIRWVAADPLRDRELAPPDSLATSTPPVTAVPAPPPAVLVSAVRGGIDNAAVSTVPAPPSSPAATAAPMRAIHAEVNPVKPAPSFPAVSKARGADADGVRVSIGSINVRVDPPGHTIAAAPPPALPRPAPQRGTRSGLSRRALRRI